MPTLGAGCWSGLGACLATAAWGAEAVAEFGPALEAGWLAGFGACLSTAAWGAGAVALPGLALDLFAGPLFLFLVLGVCCAPFDPGAVGSAFELFWDLRVSLRSIAEANASARMSPGKTVPFCDCFCCFVLLGALLLFVVCMPVAGAAAFAKLLPG